eukprot:jgi/Astpho2/748/Aster-x0032
MCLRLTVILDRLGIDGYTGDKAAESAFLLLKPEDYEGTLNPYQRNLIRAAQLAQGGKRAREAGDEGDDEAGPSKQPRTEKPLVTQSAIWQQLSAVEMKTGEIAQLPKGAGTLVSHHASRLLVREVYAKFWTLVNDIADSIVPLSTTVQAKTVVSASFNSEVSKLVRKGGFCTLYMPVWSWAEIKKARPIYPDVKVAWAKKLFDKFGGVVRHVLYLANEPETPKLIDEVVPSAAANISMLMQAGFAGGQGQSDRLLHVIPNQEYTWYHRQFASIHVQDRLAEHYTGTKGLELRTLLMDSRPPAEHAVLRGHLF